MSSPRLATAQKGCHDSPMSRHGFFFLSLSPWGGSRLPLCATSMCPTDIIIFYMCYDMIKDYWNLDFLFSQDKKQKNFELPRGKGGTSAMEGYLRVFTPAEQVWGLVEQLHVPCLLPAPRNSHYQPLSNEGQHPHPSPFPLAVLL